MNIKDGKYKVKKLFDRTAKTAFVDTIPVMTGYLVLGIGFGILLRTNGYGILWALAMSIFIYAGSMQFLGISLITSAASPLTFALSTLLVNARHLFYGISMIDRYKNIEKKKKLYLIFGLTDETYSLVCQDEKFEDSNEQSRYYFLVTFFDQIYWVTGSAVGSAVGSLITFNTQGIDFALTALFVTIFTDQWLSSKRHMPAIIGVAASVICIFIFGSSSFMIPAMAAITASLLIMKQACVCPQQADAAVGKNELKEK